MLPGFEWHALDSGYRLHAFMPNACTRMINYRTLPSGNGLSGNGLARAGILH